MIKKTRCGAQRAIVMRRRERCADAGKRAPGDVGAFGCCSDRRGVVRRERLSCADVSDVQITMFYEDTVQIHLFALTNGFIFSHIDGWQALKRELDVSWAPEVSCSKLSSSNNCSALQTIPFPRSKADICSIVCSSWRADTRAREKRDC